MIILGLHDGFNIDQHDPNVTVIKNGNIIFVLEEERLLRVKSPRGIEPVESITIALKNLGLKIRNIDYVVHPGSAYQDIKFKILKFN